jgi:hypothetical protein
VSTSTTDLLVRAQDQGFTVARRRNHHVLRSPTGQMVTLPKTPSDYRGLKNSELQLRRAGLVPGQDDHVTERNRRMARSDDGSSASAQVLEVLQATPRAVSAREIAEHFDWDLKAAANALAWLFANHAEVERPERGRYRYVRRARVQAEPYGDRQRRARPTPPPAAPPAEPHVNGNGNGNGHANGQVVLTESAADAPVAEPPEPVIDLRTPAERRPIVVTPSALPEDLPGMFEAVTTDKNNNLVLRDENGDLWLAVPLRPTPLT